MKPSLAKFAITTLSLSLSLAANSQSQEPKPIHSETAQQAISLLQAEKFDALRSLCSEFFLQSFGDVFPNTWMGIIQENGKMGDCAPPRYESQKKHEVFTATCQFERATTNVRIAIDTNGKIDFILLRRPDPK